MNEYLPSVIRRVCAQFSRRANRASNSHGTRRAKSTRRTPSYTERLEPRVMLTVSTILPTLPTWTEQGPDLITNGGVSGIGNQQNPVSGAIQAIAQDPQHPNTVLIGAVNGGIWKTTTADYSPNDT